MTAEDVLTRCQAFGVELTADLDGSMTWEADVDPPSDLVAALGRHKAEVLRLLAVPSTEKSSADFVRCIVAVDLPADWHFVWQERAAIMEADGGLQPVHADIAALAGILDRMRRAGEQPDGKVHSDAIEKATTVPGSLFTNERGPYT